tara:strand:- start:2442 stop:3065 length:624 start_codon:yes stop_codon:yes gene_type:complete
MNLSQFLIIDVVLALVGLPLLLIFQGKKAKDYLLTIHNQTREKNQGFTEIPTQQKLVELEKIARKDGSGIESKSLIGVWKFMSVWKKGRDQEDPIASSLLRLFSASLEIKENESNQFAITNLIKFGLLSIQFSGEGYLRGKQPLLPFFFQCIELKAGSTLLFSRSLEIPEENNRPFFGLISMEKHGKWLSARGRGGGLALWIKDKPK